MSDYTENVVPDVPKENSDFQDFSFIPYDNDHQSLQIGDLTFENQTDKIIVYGDIEISKNQQGLDKALKLKKLFDLMVVKLEEAKQADEFIETTSKQGLLREQNQSSKEVENPFS
ncbi:hypothetical protein [Psychrobacter sp.]|uniref:hypothetical protein n=1 Tax=Psychrobacter sp. TaxID=56811 RepID=UPI0025FDD998|nr:hypothetical protein [Psychrobacter sp.]